MAKMAKELLSQLTSEDVKGPFVTIMLNTHVAHQDVEKDQIKLKNFAKEAKKRFEKKYAEHDWSLFQEKITSLLEDASFWRSATASVALILSPKQTYIHRLSIPVDDQYYVSDLPYLLAVIKNSHFNYSYYLLGLNRDSMKLYEVNNKQVKEVKLPDDAPKDVVTALGSELTGGGLNYTSNGGEGATFHGVNPKDEEVEIDWVNYYQAVDEYFKNTFENPEKWPIYLFALPENQTMFKKVAKNPYYRSEVAISASPAQLTLKEIEEGAKKLSDELAANEAKGYNRLLDKKFIDQLVDIVPAAKEGKISHLFVATSNLVDGFGEDPETEYDRRQVLNELADNVLTNGGQVFILEQKDAPDEKSLVAILRY
ncbi:baeRF6 domain-containing protein [Enterococcus villorum]|uniref:Bacterial archaeo-eukaryotic release factor family 6 domain-containing protein n=2 Tax=Enterococcus villorum TaxID=112904 RepID=A0A511J0P9_9ENTE|nr:hypothetical protein [Enterococcus villorum]EOH86191.1 hypothetical protein UAO_02576 [Enterococcus villorum ATCC 700913]EOW78735.1 hypothetical protein I591_00278 [Enterococcus villorum ATCC 700913]GEL91601.1 hypothetical protein EVI01_09380 [Enterococcus villorum]